MSMNGCFRRLPEEDLRRLLADPELIVDYLEAQETDDYGPFADLDVDKAWQGIHYLLTGTAWEGGFPLGFILTGGTEVGEVDLGYGPARGFTAKEVHGIAVALSRIDPAELQARFEPTAMMAAEIYPNIWDRPSEEDDALAYLTEYYERLREFIAGGATEGEALLVYIG